ncbi:hypothetical protein G7Y89_g10594 [Cudoniella acicularis]|uniref:Uncharacterized protein n=1 Tax=Cudoniella acicularis TaxID=354080 RepID=A0A8H4RCG5_9HELO|nr:hypothetical protein G7Y89_g10594 [Cudoniella acicularis]
MPETLRPTEPQHRGFGEHKTPMDRMTSAGLWKAISKSDDPSTSISSGNRSRILWTATYEKIYYHQVPGCEWERENSSATLGGQQHTKHLHHGRHIALERGGISGCRSKEDGRFEDAKSKSNTLGCWRIFFTNYVEAANVAALANPIHTEEPQHIESPISPKHKLSDSRGSLSSFTSSITSTTHSRFSSLSTVCSSHHSSGLSADIVSPKSTPLEMASPSNPVDVPNSDQRPSLSLSTNDTLDTLVTIAEHRLSSQSEQQVQEANSTSDTSGKPSPTNRPSSPSDAILIKRTAVPTLRLDTGNHNMNRLELQSQTALSTMLFEHRDRSSYRIPVRNETEARERPLASRSGPGYLAAVTQNFPANCDERTKP